MIYLNLALTLINIILCQNIDDANASTPVPSGFPTSGFLVPTHVTYDLSYKCEPSSEISKLHIKTTVPSFAACNGSYTSMGTWKFDAVIRGKTEKLTIQSRDDFTFLNGNDIAPSVGHVNGGVCDGDKIVWITMASADDQRGCQSPAGVKSQTEVFVHFTFEGKCKSVCGGTGSKITFNPPINRWGLVSQ